MFDFDSLPRDVQEMIGDPRFSGCIVAHHFNRQPTHRHFYSNYEKSDGSNLSEENIDKYALNADVAQTMLKLRDERVAMRISKGGKLGNLWQTLKNDAEKFQAHLLKTYNQKHSLPMSIFRKKILDFEKEGCVIFVKDKASSAKNNAKKLDAPLETVLRAVIARSGFRPTSEEIHEMYRRFKLGLFELVIDGEILDPTSGSYPDLTARSIRSFRDKYDIQTGTDALIKPDRQKHQQKYIPAQKFERPKFSGSIVSVDDRQAPFLYRTARGTARVWLYMGIDLASEVFVAAVDGKDKKGLIHRFYEQLTQNCLHYFGGKMPHELECESSLNADLRKSGLLRDGVLFDRVRMIPNNARAKRIERYFRDFRYGMESKEKGFQVRPHGRSLQNQGLVEKQHIFGSYEEVLEVVYRCVDAWNRSPPLGKRRQVSDGNAR